MPTKRKPRKAPTEVFDFLMGRFDVSYALELVGDGREPNCQVPVGPYGKWAGTPEQGGMIRIDADHAATVDLSVPLIAVAIPVKDKGPDEVLVIDGWHRLYRARLEGVEFLPCHVLVGKEAKDVRIR